MRMCGSMPHWLSGDPAFLQAVEETIWTQLNYILLLYIEGNEVHSLSSTESEALHPMPLHALTRTLNTWLATRPGNCSVVRMAVKKEELEVVGVTVRELGSCSTEMVWLRSG